MTAAETELRDVSGRVRMGEVLCPSGQLVIVDGGYLGAWSGSRSPRTVDPEALGITDPEMAAEVASAVDFEITGPDAEAAARALDRQPGQTLYDVPGSKAEKFAGQRFPEFCRERGLTASLVPFADQVPHRDRVARAVAGSGADGFQIFGIPAVAVGGLPADRALPVWGIRSSSDEFEDGWESMVLPVADAPVARTVEVGVVGVDWARLMFADAEALADWKHEEPIDGLADVAFWGLHAPEAAAALDTSFLGTDGEPGVYGWSGLPVAEAFDQALAVEAWKDAEPGRRLAFDFRPHSHHWQVMAGVRASATESATIDIGGATLLMAMTGRGDGVFPVYVDYGDDGRLVAIRVEFA